MLRESEIAPDTVTKSLPPAIFLMGPTASGKTDLAVSLSRALPVELISVDSALIYKGMDIGTAKPEPEILAQAPHALIDIIEPWESYSVARFYEDVLAAMQAITKRGNIPLLVGGTMMYFRVLRDGIASLPSADETIRAGIVQQAEQFGWESVHQRLQEVDPESAARIKPTDSQRLQRALEVYLVSGKTMTDFWRVQNESGKPAVSDYTKQEGALPPIPYRLISLAIAPEHRADLHDRIRLRFELMLENGFLDEVERLFHSGTVDASMSSMRCVGYRQAWAYLEGKLTKEEMIERGVIATRQLAKRQLTWLRSWPDLTWLHTEDKKVFAKALKIIKDATS